MSEKQTDRPATESERWPAPALATLYRAAVSFGTQETQLIWTRYTGFLVLNGFLLTAYTEISRDSIVTGAPNPWPWVLLTIGSLGLLFNAVWHALNFAGWQNQCLWYHRAAMLSPRLNDFRLPTDYFKERIPRPSGWIYWLAQMVPTGLSIAAAIALIFATRTLMPDSCPALVLSASTIILAGAVLIIEYCIIARGVEGRSR